MDEIFKVLTGETHKARSMYPAKLSSVSEEEIKTSQTSKNLRNWLPVELPCKKCQKFLREEGKYIDQKTVSFVPRKTIKEEMSVGKIKFLLFHKIMGAFYKMKLCR